jgi:hypothetical protein
MTDDVVWSLPGKSLMSGEAHQPFNRLMDSSAYIRKLLRTLKSGFQCIIRRIRVPRGGSWLRTNLPRCGFLYVADALCAAICSGRRMAEVTQPSFV